MKYEADESFERYKTMLVGKRYTQTYDIDYQDIFALIAKMDTV